MSFAQYVYGKGPVVRALQTWEAVTFSAWIELAVQGSSSVLRRWREEGSADFNPAVHTLYKSINVERLKHF